MMISLSIIIPTYKRPELLKRCLMSVVKERGDFEIFVIDDASNDTTEEVVRSLNDERIVYLLQDKNRGVNAARNRAIGLSKSEWVFCLDDDDELLPGAIDLISKRLSEMPQNYNVAYFNSKIKRDAGDLIGGFQFGAENFFDPSYLETMTKYNLKGDCKPAFRKVLFDNQRYKFPESVNGFESYTMNIIAKDNKGIRYWKDVVTLIHQESALIDRLSVTASKKNPWPLLVLHVKQLFEHFIFYTKKPIFLYKKIKDIIKLLVRSLFSLFGIRW